jgi:hypothetical protein
MKNHINFWIKSYFRDALRLTKFVLGVGISVILASDIHFILGLLCIGYICTDFWIEGSQTQL